MAKPGKAGTTMDKGKPAYVIQVRESYRAPHSQEQSAKQCICGLDAETSTGPGS